VCLHVSASTDPKNRGIPPISYPEHPRNAYQLRNSGLGLTAHVPHTVNEELKLDLIASIGNWGWQKFDRVSHPKSSAPQQHLKGRRLETESESFKRRLSVRPPGGHDPLREDREQAAGAIGGQQAR